MAVTPVDACDALIELITEVRSLVSVTTAETAAPFKVNETVPATEMPLKVAVLVASAVTPIPEV